MNDLTSSSLGIDAPSSQSVGANRAVNDIAAKQAALARASQSDVARNQAASPLVERQDDVSKNRIACDRSRQEDVAESEGASLLLDWKRAHAELVALARKQACLDTQIGRWLLYARRAATHAFLGYGSIDEYAQQLFGFTPRQTQERLRVAEALEELPMLGRAFAQGTLCWSAVREVSRVATPETESQWLAASQGRNAHQIEEMVKGHGRGDGPEDPAHASSLRRVLRFDLSPATYATVQEALTKIRRNAGGRLDDDEALLLMARNVLGGPADVGRGSYQIAISMCPSCERGFQHARGELVELSPPMVDAACCDAQHIGDVRMDRAQTHVGARTGGCRGEQGKGDGALQSECECEGERAWESKRESEAERANGEAETHAGARTDAWRGERDGETKRERGSLSRTARAKQNLSPRIRRLVLRRARQQCEVATCKNSIFLDVHHRTLRSEGGTHDENELVVLCGAHHTAIHEGRLLLEGDARSGWTFRHADGTVYGTAPAPQQVDVAVKVFRGLCTLGFKQGDARRALDHVTRQTDAGAAMTTERVLRDAVFFLTH